jgi:hypothetical protein
MRNRTSNTIILLVFLTCSACTDNNPPSETITVYTEENDEALGELYFYPTTVRMLEKVLTTGSQEGVFEGVESGRILYGKSDSLDILKQDFDELVKGVNKEGFELLVEFKSRGERTVAYVREGSPNRYIALLSGGVSTILVELEGDLSLETIRGLSQLNSENVMSLFDLPKPESENQGDSEEEADSSRTKQVKFE